MGSLENKPIQILAGWCGTPNQRIDLSIPYCGEKYSFSGNLPLSL